MIKLVSHCGKHEMWIKPESVTAITKVPQSGYENLVFWNILGQGWGMMVKELPNDLRKMVS